MKIFNLCVLGVVAVLAVNARGKSNHRCELKSSKDASCVASEVQSLLPKTELVPRSPAMNLEPPAPEVSSNESKKLTPNLQLKPSTIKSKGLFQ